MTNKPREFWLIENEGPSEAGFPVTRAYSSKQRFIRTEPKPQIHVIEAAPVLKKIRRLELALEKCKEQRDLYLCKDTNESEGIFDERIEFNAELESILEGK